MRSAVGSRRGVVAAALTAAAVLAALPAAGSASGREASAAGGAIVFRRNVNVYGQGYLWAVNADGSRPRRVLGSGWVSDAALSPDGKGLAIVDKCAIKVMPAGGGPQRTIVRPRIRRSSLGERFSDCFGGLSWSPDGKRLVFIRCPLHCTFSEGSVLLVVGANGRGRRQLTQRDCVSGKLWYCQAQFDISPNWSPDGQTILFAHLDISLPDPPYDNWANSVWLYTVSPDGSGLARLSPRYGLREGVPSPDGTRIAFTRVVFTTLPPTAVWTGSIGVMNADGSSEQTLVQEDQGQHHGRDSCDGHGGWSVAWSPDGSKLAYSGPCPQGVYVMNGDGSDRVRLTRGRYDTLLDWRPLPGR